MPRRAHELIEYRFGLNFTPSPEEAQQVIEKYGPVLEKRFLVLGEKQKTSLWDDSMKIARRFSGLVENEKAS